ncbi:MAG: DUF1194 domain-containing protein [Pseudomonadota bacterium]
MTDLLHRVLITIFAFVTILWTNTLEHAEAQTPTQVDVELVLAVDVSNSMDSEERILQRKGYEVAFRHPDIITTIKSGLLGRIAVTYIEWADRGRQHVTVPWMLIEDKGDAEAFADRLAQERLLRMRRTAIDDALLFSASLFGHNHFSGLRRVIDISGDGPSNEGGDVSKARDAVLQEGIIINGLPILLKKETHDEKLDLYYEDCVIGGPGSFIVAVRKTEEFVKAIRQKILLEIASATPKIWHAQLQYRRAPRVSCSAK